MKNIYCRNSRLSSLCMRALIERYAAGDTATQAQRYLVGLGGHPTSEHAPREPSPQEAAMYINRFLSIYPSSYAQVCRFADACRESRPDQWHSISISRQTVNAYFLRLGQYCWRHIAEPHLAWRARQTVRVFDEINRELGLIDDELTGLLVEKMAARYVNHANGTLFAERDVRLRYGHTIVYLTERARKFQGLNVRYCREHMAWAFLLNSVRRAQGRDDRAYGARYLVSLLMRQPL